MQPSARKTSGEEDNYDDDDYEDFEDDSTSRQGEGDKKTVEVTNLDLKNSPKNQNLKFPVDKKII